MRAPLAGAMAANFGGTEIPMAHACMDAYHCDDCSTLYEHTALVLVSVHSMNDTTMGRKINGKQ